jgi:sortase A
MWIKKHWSTILLLLILLAGVGLVTYPTFADWWNSFHQSRAIAGYADSVAQIDDSYYEELMEQAREFNKSLLNRDDSRFNMSDEDREIYNNILNIDGSGIIGYIEVPKVNISLPIYHGTSEAVLQVAAGHIEGTSFPVGGEGTHAVVSGHRGLPSAKLFTDLDQIEEGDIIQMTILDDVLTYQVDQIRIVLPNELSDLAIDPEKDLVTLVTCTPYGINSHRLLVRGHRIDNPDSGDVRVTSDATQYRPINVLPIVAGIIILLVLIGFGVSSHHSRVHFRIYNALMLEHQERERRFSLEYFYEKHPQIRASDEARAKAAAEKARIEAEKAKNLKGKPSKKLKKTEKKGKIVKQKTPKSGKPRKSQMPKKSQKAQMEQKAQQSQLKGKRGDAEKEG